jgi:hypothetical protein
MGSGGIAPFLTSAVDGGEWLHAAAALPYRERAHGTLWKGGWMGPRPSLNGVE